MVSSIAITLLFESSLLIDVLLVPIEVGFVETVYTVGEDESEVNVCVNITRPDNGIFINETFNVSVIYDSNSVYIPAGSPLSSESLPTACRLT